MKTKRQVSSTKRIIVLLFGMLLNTEVFFSQYNDYQTRYYNCGGPAAVRYEVQFPNCAVMPDNTPIFIMNHEAGDDDPTTYIWMNTTNSNIVKLRTVLNNEKWVYVTPYYYNVTWGAGGRAEGYNIMIDSIKAILRREYKCKADSNPLYIGGGSLGGSVSLSLVRLNPPGKFKGLALFHSCMWWYNTGRNDNLLGTIDYSSFNIPVYIHSPTNTSLPYNGAGDGENQHAITRFYQELRKNNKTVKMIFNNSGGHSPRNIDPQDLVDFMKNGNTGKQEIHWWRSNGTSPTGLRSIIDPYNLRPAADSSYLLPYGCEPKTRNYTYSTAETFPEKPVNDVYEYYVADPVIIPGWPLQERTKNRRVFMFRQNDSYPQGLSYCYFSGIGNYDPYKYSYWFPFLAYLNNMGWLFVTPRSFEYNQLEKEVNTYYPDFSGAMNYGAGIGYGGKRLAQMVLQKPGFYSGLLFSEPEMDSALADTLSKIIPCSVPVVVSVRKGDSTNNGDAIRYFYQLMKSKKLTVMLMEKNLIMAETKGFAMHTGRYEFDFIMKAKCGDYKKVNVDTLSVGSVWPRQISLKYSIAEEGHCKLSNQKPVVKFYMNLKNDTLIGNTNIKINISAMDPDGKITILELLKDGVIADTLKKDMSSGFYTYTYASLPVGWYSFKAVATDDSAALSSDSIHIYIKANEAPIVIIKTPADGDTLKPGTSVKVTAAIKDNDGSVAKAIVLADGVVKGNMSKSGSDYIYYVTGPAEGIHQITVRAYDDLNDSTETSVSILIAKPLILSEADVNFAAYPNPVADYLNIAGDQSLQKEMTIISIEGKLISAIITPYSIISMSQLESGMYIVTVKYRDGSSRQIKVIKE